MKRLKGTSALVREAEALSKLIPPNAVSEEDIQEAAAELRKNYSKQDLKRIFAFYERRDKNRPPKFQMGESDNTVAGTLVDSIALHEACGTTDADLANTLLDQAQRTLFSPQQPIANKCNIAAAILHGIKPRDELEGLLAVQMVGVHNLAMEFMKRAILEEQTPEGVDANVNRATKLLRTFTAQIEALNRHRGKGQHKMTVEHVHVNAGGQAIVGCLEGGGSNNENRG